MPSLTCVVNPVRKATSNVGNCFWNSCRWLQRTRVRELCLGSWIYKLWLNILFKIEAKFSTLKFLLSLVVLGSATGQVLWEKKTKPKPTISKQLQPITRMELGKREGCLPHGKKFRQPLLCKPPGAEAWKMEQGSPRQRCTLAPETAKSKN